MKRIDIINITNVIELIKKLIDFIKKILSLKFLFAFSFCGNCILMYLLFISKAFENEIEEIGINLITLLGNFGLSFLVSIIYAKFSEKENEEKELLREKRIEEKMQEMYLKSLNMAPTYVYSDANQPIEDFNKRLNKSIENTTYYYFFSDRGLYVSKRLLKDIKNCNERFCAVICLQDIRDKRVFKARSKEYKKREINLGGSRTDKEIISDEKLNVLKSLYVLSRLEKIDVKIYLHREIPLMRFEITDDILAISFLPMLIKGSKYPPTLIYENEELFRPAYLDYFKNVKKRSIQVKKEDITIDYLLKLGKKAKIKNITENAIVEYYNELMQ